MTDSEFIEMTEAAAHLNQAAGLSGDQMIIYQEVIRLCALARKGVYAVAKGSTCNEHKGDAAKLATLLRRADSMLDRWEEKGVDLHRDTLPPAGHINLREDIAAALGKNPAGENDVEGAGTDQWMPRGPKVADQVPATSDGSDLTVVTAGETATTSREPLVGSRPPDSPGCVYPAGGRWMIVYDDTDVRPEHIDDVVAARKRLAQVSNNWNCHLYARIATTARDTIGDAPLGPAPLKPNDTDGPLYRVIRAVAASRVIFPHRDSFSPAAPFHLKLADLDAIIQAMVAWWDASQAGEA